MKHFLVAITVCVLTNLSFATTNFQQGAGNAVSSNADDTFQKLMDACGDVSILGLRARARLEMNRATPDDQSKIVEMMDQAMATCGSGDIEKAAAQMNEVLAVPYGLQHMRSEEHFMSDNGCPRVTNLVRKETNLD